MAKASGAESGLKLRPPHGLRHVPESRAREKKLSRHSTTSIFPQLSALEDHEIMMSTRSSIEFHSGFGGQKDQKPGQNQEDDNAQSPKQHVATISNSRRYLPSFASRA